MKALTEFQYKKSISIIEECAVHYNTTYSDIISESRSFNSGVLPARFMAVLLLRRFNLKYEQIAFLLNRKHNSIIHCMRKQTDYMSVYKYIRDDYNLLVEKLGIDVQLNLL